MNSFEIFFDRVKRDYLFQYKIIKTVFDWTVLLYLVIPTLIITFFIYRSWWLELPEWSEYLSLPLLAILAYFVSSTDSYRTFVKEADGIFLLKHKKKFTNLKKSIFVYSLGKSALKIIVFTTIVSPFFLFQFSLNIGEILCFMLFYIGFSYFISAIKMIIRSQFQGWQEKVFLWTTLFALFLCNVMTFSNFVTVPLYSISIAILFLGISLCIFIPRIHSTKYFQKEVSEENKQRLRYINLIAGASPNIEKPKIFQRKKPFLFRQSTRIFKRNLAYNGFLELFFKIILRNFTYLSGYFRLLGVTGVALVAVPPIYLKLIILIGFSFFIWIWVANLWDKVILSNPIGKHYSNYDSFFRARKKAGLLLSLPSIGILVFIVIVQFFITAFLATLF
ncbi:ABC transporter permease [Bacillus sp. V3B]|uniref:ABC transporter permease n=1 Tax=Bacillus sp. V3B TaxID=2804915 RepID=UPI002108F2D5|nr:ABC transporter permease [Bacillus sp. V3B]MCQ6274940.1 ABC transporter permease [Bacillus sp. V3B]